MWSLLFSGGVFIKVDNEAQEEKNLSAQNQACLQGFYFKKNKQKTVN